MVTRLKKNLVEFFISFLCLLEEPVVSVAIAPEIQSFKTLCSRLVGEHWCRWSQVSRDELDWSANELRNCLRAIDWDLEDLSETISIL